MITYLIVIKIKKYGGVLLLIHSGHSYLTWDDLETSSSIIELQYCEIAYFTVKIFQLVTCAHHTMVILMIFSSLS